MHWQDRGQKRNRLAQTCLERGGMGRNEKDPGGEGRGAEWCLVGLLDCLGALWDPQEPWEA
eukprot:1581643-Pyramimonas_sp.AAC.1